MRRPPVIGLIVALLLTLVFWFFLYKPASEQEAAIIAERETLEGQAAQLRTQIAALRDIESRQVEIRAALARLEEYLPSGPAQPATIRQLQRAVDASGTELKIVSFGELAVPTAAEGATPANTGTPGTTLANIPISVSVEGGYFQIVDFLRRLEVEVPRAVLIESLAITESVEEGFPTVATALSGQVFAVVESGDLVDTDAGVPPPNAGATPSPSPSPSPQGGAP